MRLVLQSLYDDLSRERAIDAIRSSNELARLRRDLQQGSADRLGIAGIPDGDYGDNLLLALLALRTKFEIDEARAKLETNIDMRARRGGMGSR